jgi:hypothetical protein
VLVGLLVLNRMSRVALARLIAKVLKTEGRERAMRNNEPRQEMDVVD